MMTTDHPQCQMLFPCGWVRWCAIKRCPSDRQIHDVTTSRNCYKRPSRSTTRPVRRRRRLPVCILIHAVAPRVLQESSGPVTEDFIRLMARHRGLNNLTGALRDSFGLLHAAYLMTSRYRMCQKKYRTLNYLWVG